MILNILILVHIIVSFLIILFILLNKSKGSEISANFNTPNANLIDLRNTNTFLKKIIILLALTSLFLTFSISHISKNIKNIKEKPIVTLIDK